MKILVTGSDGLLGHKIQQAGSEHHIIPTSRNSPYYPLDVTNPVQIKKALAAYQPEVVINTAAMTHVDACETQREKAMMVNSAAAGYLAALCHEKNIRLVHISTDFIFDGTAGPYDENAVPNPINYYGQTKWLGEKQVLSNAKDFIILRTVLVYGYVPALKRNNIVLWIKQNLEEKKSIQLVTDQYRTPTWAEDLATGCLLAAASPATGIVNIAGPDMMNMYELGLQVARHFGLDSSLIRPVDSTQFTQPAQRPLITGLLISKAMQDLGYRPHSFEDSLGKMGL